MESISIKGKRGRPRRRPRILYADTKYNMPLNKFYLDGKHVRSMIERFNGWIKVFRRVATMFDRLPQVYMGFVRLACIMVYLRVLQ